MAGRGKKKKSNSGQKATSINIAKLAYVAYVSSIAAEGLGEAWQEGRRDWHNILRTPLENLAHNYKFILGGGLAIALIGKAVGRWMPRFGIRKLVSIKPI